MIKFTSFKYFNKAFFHKVHLRILAPKIGVTLLKNNIKSSDNIMTSFSDKKFKMEQIVQGNQIYRTFSGHELNLGVKHNEIGLSKKLTMVIDGSSRIGFEGLSTREKMHVIWNDHYGTLNDNFIYELPELPEWPSIKLKATSFKCLTLEQKLIKAIDYNSLSGYTPLTRYNIKGVIYKTWFDHCNDIKVLIYRNSLKGLLNQQMFNNKHEFSQFTPVVNSTQILTPASIQEVKGLFSHDYPVERTLEEYLFNSLDPEQMPGYKSWALKQHLVKALSAEQPEKFKSLSTDQKVAQVLAAHDFEIEDRYWDDIKPRGISRGAPRLKLCDRLLRALADVPELGYRLLTTKQKVAKVLAIHKSTIKLK
jgi:hypothetical protein